MSSDARANLLDLDRGLPTTAADVEALRRLPMPTLTTADYMSWLRWFEPKDASVLRDRRGPSGDEPFRL